MEKCLRKGRLVCRNPFKIEGSKCDRLVVLQMLRTKIAGNQFGKKIYPTGEFVTIVRVGLLMIVRGYGMCTQQ